MADGTKRAGGEQIGAAMSHYWPAFLFTVVIAAMSPVACGGSFFTLTMSTTSEPPQTVTASGSDLTSLLQDAVKQRKQFAALAGRDVTASLSYGRVVGAVTLSRNAAGTSVTLGFPKIGISKTITGAGAPRVSELLGNYLHRQAEGLLSKFNKRQAGFSKWLVVDGNPSAATAFQADDAFYRWGIPRNRQTEGGTWIAAEAEAIHAEGKNGGLAAATIGCDFPINERMAISLDLGGNYREVAGTRSYNIVSTTWGLPMKVYKAPLLEGFDWTLTPYVFGNAAFSKQLLDGGGVYGVGGVSSLAYHTGNFTFILGNQISYNAGLNIDINSVRYGNTKLSTSILKNGLQVEWSPNEQFFADGGIAYTNFLQDAAVKNYWSPSMGIGWQFTPSATIRAGLFGNYANGYTATGCEVSFSYTF
jgi:hypothetical protein